MPGGARDEGEARCGCCEIEDDLALRSTGADAAGADDKACDAEEAEQPAGDVADFADPGSALFGDVRMAGGDRDDGACRSGGLFARPSRLEWEGESRVEPVGYAAGESRWRRARRPRSSIEGAQAALKGEDEHERIGPSLHLTMGVEALVSEAPVHSAHSTVQSLLNSQSLVAPEWAVKDAYVEPWLSSSFEFAGKPGSARAGQPPPSDSPLFWGAFMEALARLTSRDPNFRRSLKIEDTTAAQRKESGHDGALPEWAEHLKVSLFDVPLHFMRILLTI